MIKKNWKSKKKHPFLNSKNIKLFSVDISKKEKVKSSLNKILNFLEKIDVLVNLAAIDTNTKGKFDKKINFHNFPYEILKKSIDINLLGTLNVSQAFCNYFIKNNISGNIINGGLIYSIVALILPFITKNFQRLIISTNQLIMWYLNNQAKVFQ